MDFGDFIGGFAETLKTNVDANLQLGRDQQRDRARMELEKEYAKEVVASTGQVGNEVVSYNKYGDVIRRRPMTAEEIRLRDASLKTAELGVRQGELGVEKGEFEVANQDRILEDELATRAASRASSYASAEASRASASLAQQRYNDERGDRRLPKALADEAFKIETSIWAVPPNGVNSPAAQAAAFQNELEGAIASGNEGRVRQVLAKWKGATYLPLLKSETEARSTTNSMFGGRALDDPNPPGSR